MKKSTHHDIAAVLLFLATFLTVVAVSSVLAFAQEAQPCGPRDKVEKRIWKEYGESVLGAGLTPGGIMYLTANLQTGTFTILLRRPDGMACVLMGGRGFAQGEPRTPGVGL